MMVLKSKRTDAVRVRALVQLNARATPNPVRSDAAGASQFSRTSGACSLPRSPSRPCCPLSSCSYV